jgi:hypothetical protein
VAFLPWVLLKPGAPGEIRTPDPLVRSQILYPTELRAHLIPVPQAKQASLQGLRIIRLDLTIVNRKTADFRGVTGGVATFLKIRHCCHAGAALPIRRAVSMAAHAPARNVPCR